MERRLRTEAHSVKVNRWLLPLSRIYGAAVWLRNKLFDAGALKSRRYPLPVIAVGNIAVGGSGKTPHVEYIARLLKGKAQVAILSRGYKRRTKGYVLAGAAPTAEEIGDEPCQMKRKLPWAHVAVCNDRRQGIERLTTDKETRDTGAVVLDDAYQHRYVKPGLNILLTDYRRLFAYDELLPAGRLREPASGKSRADIVVVTKCPKDITPMECRVVSKALDLFPYQKLYFTHMEYGSLCPVAGGKAQPLGSVPSAENILLVTGIAAPGHMLDDLRQLFPSIRHMAFPDHHRFTAKDAGRIGAEFAAMPAPKRIITTEKDATRLAGAGLPAEALAAAYALEVRVEFMHGQKEKFNETINTYVRKNQRNGGLAKAKDVHKPKNRDHTRNGPRTISFRNN